MALLCATLGELFGCGATCAWGQSLGRHLWWPPWCLFRLGNRSLARTCGSQTCCDKPSRSCSFDSGFSQRPSTLEPGKCSLLQLELILLASPEGLTRKPWTLPRSTAGLWKQFLNCGVFGPIWIACFEDTLPALLLLGSGLNISSTQTLPTPWRTVCHVELTRDPTNRKKAISG